MGINARAGFPGNFWMRLSVRVRDLEGVRMRVSARVGVSESNQITLVLELGFQGGLE